MSSITLSRSPESRFIGVEIFAVLLTVGLVGMIGSLGGVRAGAQAAPMACPAAPRVSSAQVDAAAARVRAAAETLRYTSTNGSPYAAAKIGLPLSSAEHRQAEAAALDLAAAKRDLASACAAAGG